MMRMPAPLIYPPASGESRFGHAAPTKTEAGFVVSGAGMAGRHVYTIARHGEVAEWLKAAPC